MDQKGKNSLLQNEWANFNSNMGALCTFFESLTQTADKLDQDRKKKFAIVVADLLGENPEQFENEIAEYVPSIDDLDVFPDYRDNESVREFLKTLQDNEFKTKLLRWENRNPHKSHKLAKVISSVFNNPPISGFILRKGILITLVTFLEVLLESLFVDHHLLNGVVREDAIKKTKKLMSGGWENKLNNLVEIGIPETVSTLFRSEILGITRLRNLLVHNDGVVDQEYLEKSVSKDRHILKPGNILVVSTNRLERALHIVFVYGFLLCQSHWRIHENNDHLQNEKIDQLFISSLDERRYGLVLQLSESIRILNLPINIQQRILVDRAIAFRELKKVDEVATIISQLKASQHDWQIEIAITMLNSDYPKLQRQLIKVQNRSDIRKFAHWPLFDPIRDEFWFKRVFMMNRKKIDISSTHRRKK